MPRRHPVEFRRKVLVPSRTVRSHTFQTLDEHLRTLQRPCRFDRSNPISITLARSTDHSPVVSAIGQVVGSAKDNATIRSFVAPIRAY